MSLLARNKYATLIHFTSQASVHHILGFLITVISPNKLAVILEPCMFYLSTPWSDILAHVEVSAKRYFGTVVILCQKHQAETSPRQVSLFRNEPKYLGAKVSQCQNIHRDKISMSWKVCRAKRYKCKNVSSKMSVK